MKNSEQSRTDRRVLPRSLLVFRSLEDLGYYLHEECRHNEGSASNISGVLDGQKGWAGDDSSIYECIGRKEHWIIIATHPTSYLDAVIGRPSKRQSFAETAPRVPAVD